MPAIGPHTRPNRLAKLDGRCREARYLRRIKRELTEHLGGAVSTPQRILIERLAVDLLRLELMDAKVATGTLTDLDGRVAHALRSSVRLALRDLGLEAPASPPSTFADVATTINAGKAAADLAGLTPQELYLRLING